MRALALPELVRARRDFEERERHVFESVCHLDVAYKMRLIAS